MNIIYEPYVFSFILSLLISIVYYVYQKNKVSNIDDEDNVESDNLLAQFVVVLLLSYIIIMIIYYSYKYISFEFKTSLPVMAGGAIPLTQLNKNSDVEKAVNLEELNERREKMMDRLTIVDDDIDVSILED